MHSIGQSGIMQPSRIILLQYETILKHVWGVSSRQGFGCRHDLGKSKPTKPMFRHWETNDAQRRRAGMRNMHP